MTRNDGTMKFTEGVIWRQLLLFAIPLFGSSLIQQLYGTVDLMFVGRFLGREAAAAVGASTFLVAFLIGLFVGISVGVSVVAAQAFGRADDEELRRTIHTAAALCLMGGLALTVVGWAMAPTFLRWLNVPEGILRTGVEYMRIYLLSVLSMLAYNISSGILRALGDSTSPVKYQLAGGLVNVAADAFFIIALGWGVRGAALATLCSQTLAAALTVWRLTRLDEGYRLSLRHWALEGSILRSILTVGVPAGLQGTIMTLSNLLIQHDINSLGITAIAVFAVYFKLENFIWLPIVSFGQTITPFVSQNIGAGKPDRAHRGVLACIAMGVMTTVCISGILLLIPERALGMFSTDPEVIAMGRRVILLPFTFYFLYVFLEVLSSAIRGAGRSLAVMLIVVLNMSVTRICLLKIIMAIAPSPESVAVLYPITWGITVTALVIYYRILRARQ